MDNTRILNDSRFDQPAWHLQKRHITGTGVSFLIHGIVLCCIIFVSAALSNFTPPLIIDFSIEEHDGDMTPTKGNAKVVRQETPPAPQIKPPPPVPQPLPKKAEVIIPEKIEPIVTKKIVMEKEEPKQVEVQPVKKTIPETIISSAEPVDATRNTLAEKNDSTPSPGPLVTPSPSLQKEQYKKKHFDYIEEMRKESRAGSPTPA